MNVSAMSFGAISHAAIRALNGGAKLGQYCNAIVFFGFCLKILFLSFMQAIITVILGKVDVPNIIWKWVAISFGTLEVVILGAENQMASKIQHSIFCYPYCV
jgi:hypothetical protein